MAHRLNLVGRQVLSDLPVLYKISFSSQRRKSGDFTQNPKFWSSLKQ